MRLNDLPKWFRELRNGLDYLHSAVTSADWGYDTPQDIDEVVLMLNSKYVVCYHSCEGNFRFLGLNRLAELARELDEWAKSEIVDPEHILEYVDWIYDSSKKRFVTARPELTVKLETCEAP